MIWQLSTSMDDASGLARDLRALGELRAPATILSAVLERVGLPDAYAIVKTAVGPLFVAFNDRGVVAVKRAASAAAFERAFAREFGRPARRVQTLPAALARRLQRPGRDLGRRSLRVDLRGLSEFEAAVLRKAQEIPRGEVRTYAWVAREIGHPAAVRAVGTALGKNPVPLLIPCHRVVRTDGRIGDYVFGTPAKRRLLDGEGIDPDALERLSRSGTRYLGSGTTKIYCFPTCRNARRISERHRVAFRSDEHARAAGYRPCKACRPAVPRSA